MNPLPAGLNFASARHVWQDGTFSDVVTLRFPSAGLYFEEIEQQDREVKLQTIARLRAVKAQARGVHEPRTILLALPGRDCAADVLFPDLDCTTDTGERLYSANSFLQYVLRELLARRWLSYDGKTWRSEVPDNQPTWQARARAVLRFLQGEGRLRIYGELGRPLRGAADLDGFDVKRDLIPVARLGFIRETVWRRRPRVAFNAAYFLLEHDDFAGHHAALGEAYNLYVRDGKVLRPPLYRRAGLYQRGDGVWQASRMSLADVSLTLPGGLQLRPPGTAPAGPSFTLEAGGDAPIIIYTRATGLPLSNEPLRETPRDPNRIEYTLVDTRVVGWKRGGGLAIPQNGLILSCDRRALPADAIPDHGLPRIRYAFAREPLSTVRQALQAGPLLVQDGALALAPVSLAQEQFWPTPPVAPGDDRVGIVPTDYPDDVDRTRAGRIGLGVDAEGQMIIVALPGTERGSHRPAVDSSGATLLELAQLLADAGAQQAINLDGGGSTQLFVMGGLATLPGNRYRIPGLSFERMVPCIGVLDA
jgi:hypothetical protein